MKKLFLLISLWCCYSMLSGSYAQTVFLEDFSEGQASLDKWEFTPHSSSDVYGYKVSNTGYCGSNPPEFNLYFQGEEKWNNKSEKASLGINMVSPIFDLAAYDHINFSMDYYRLEHDFDAGEIRLELFVKNDLLEDWHIISDYTFMSDYGVFKTVPFACAIDSSFFKKPGFQFKLNIGEFAISSANSRTWISMDNIKLFVPPQTDLTIIDQYPNKHALISSPYTPCVLLMNAGIQTVNGSAVCMIREHLSGEVVYHESVNVQEMQHMDTLSVSFPEVYLPYNNHLYHVEYKVDCEGDQVQENNTALFDLDSYTYPFQNEVCINVMYSTRYSFGYRHFDRYPPDLKEVVDTLARIRKEMSSVVFANYIYDEIPDSSEMPTVFSCMNDYGFIFKAGEPSYARLTHMPCWSIFPGKVISSIITYGFQKQYREIFTDIKEKQKCPFILDIFGTHSALDYDIMVELTPKAPIVNDRLKLRTVITRSHIPTYQNPDISSMDRFDFFDDVVQMALPDTNGIAFAMDGSETSPKQWEMSFSLKDFWDPEQVKIVTYVQDTFTYDIIQCKAVNLLDLWGVGVGEPAQSPAESVLITPNPAKDVLYAQLELEMPANILFRLHDINGRDLGILKESFLGAGKHNVSIQLPESIKSGIYILQTETGRQSYSQKLNVLR